MNVWEPIRDPGELARIGENELFARLRPLLRQGRLLSNWERLERLRPNLRSVCAELAADWERSPLLAGKRVGFAAYLAVRLCSGLRELDQEQYPELYDPHRRYQPEAAPAALEEQPVRERAEKVAAAAWVAAQERDPEPLSGPERLRKAMAGAGIAAASQIPVLETMAALARDRISSPHRFSRSLGRTTLEARTQPATSAYLHALELIEHFQPVASSR